MGNDIRENIIAIFQAIIIEDFEQIYLISLLNKGLHKLKESDWKILNRIATQVHWFWLMELAHQMKHPMDLWYWTIKYFIELWMTFRTGNDSASQSKSCQRLRALNRIHFCRLVIKYETLHSLDFFKSFFYRYTIVSSFLCLLSVWRLHDFRRELSTLMEEKAGEKDYLREKWHELEWG